MADDKKKIGPEVEKTDTTPAPEQPVPGKVEPVVADPAPAPAGEVVDFDADREEAGKDKTPKEKATIQKTTELKDKAAVAQAGLQAVCQGGFAASAGAADANKQHDSYLPKCFYG